MAVVTLETAEAWLPITDGLRAVAVLAVVLFHFFPGAVPGGYIGVDVLFVISGFVIALRYLPAIVAGEIGIGQFFLRRIQRLGPAYFVLLVAVVIAGIERLLATSATVHVQKVARTHPTSTAPSRRWRPSRAHGGKCSTPFPPLRRDLRLRHERQAGHSDNNHLNSVGLSRIRPIFKRIFRQTRSG